MIINEPASYRKDTGAHEAGDKQDYTARAQRSKDWLRDSDGGAYHS